MIMLVTSPLSQECQYDHAVSLSTLLAFSVIELGRIPNPSPHLTLRVLARLPTFLSHVQGHSSASSYTSTTPLPISTAQCLLNCSTPQRNKPLSRRPVVYRLYRLYSSSSLRQPTRQPPPDSRPKANCQCAIPHR